MGVAGWVESHRITQEERKREREIGGKRDGRGLRAIKSKVISY